MSEMDKVKNDAEHVKGQVKEKVGDVIDDEDLAARGRADQAEADVKNAAEDVKGAARRAKDAVTE